MVLVEDWTPVIIGRRAFFVRPKDVQIINERFLSPLATGEKTFEEIYFIFIPVWDPETDSVVEFLFSDFYSGIWKWKILLNLMAIQKHNFLDGFFFLPPLVTTTKLLYNPLR